MSMRPPRATLTYTLVPYTTPFRSLRRDVEAEEFGDGAAEVERPARRRHAPDKSGRSLEQFAQGALALVQGGVGPAEDIDVETRAVPTRNAAVVGACRADREAVPNIDRKSTRLNYSPSCASRLTSSA